MKRRLDLLVSPLFMAALFALLLNDLVLKTLFHNLVTGKLSDVAGLFIFPLFWAAFFPRHKRAIYLLTAILFIFWKSASSEPLIAAWNRFAALPVQRVVDATDLLALSVLPLSYLYMGDEKQLTRPRFAPYLLAAISLFAFTATSYHTSIDYDQKFYFEGSQAELTRKVYHLEHLDASYDVSPCHALAEPQEISLTTPSDFCFNQVTAVVRIGEEQGQAVMSLRKMEHRCPEGKYDKPKLLAIFESQVVEKLKQLKLPPPVVDSSDTPLALSTNLQLRGSGLLYFVPLGDLPDVDLKELASHFKKRLGLTIKILPTLPLTTEVRAREAPYSRPVAELLIELMQRSQQKLGARPEATLIGIVEDMYVQRSRQIYPHSYQADGQFAVVAAKNLDPATFCEPANEELFKARLQKIIARQIGRLYYRLPRSDNPQSVLYSYFDCVDELDAEKESF